MAKMALYYLVQKQISWQDYRFDIVPIEYTEGRDQPKANLIRNAFSVKGCYLNELLCNDCMLSIEIPYL